MIWIWSLFNATDSAFLIILKSQNHPLYFCHVKLSSLWTCRDTDTFSFDIKQLTWAWADISEHFLGDIKIYIKTKVKWHHQKNTWSNRQKGAATLEVVPPQREKCFYKFQTLGQLLKQFWHWSFYHPFHRKRARILVKLTDGHSSGSSLDFSVNKPRKSELYRFSSMQERGSSWADAQKCSRKPE